MALRKLKAEGMGFEPTCNSTATDDGLCRCEFCQGYRAARALYVGSPNCPGLASFDTDLQQVIATWDGLPDAIRKAVTALVGVQKTGG
jgi:hypothetical protein